MNQCGSLSQRSISTVDGLDSALAEAGGKADWHRCNRDYIMENIGANQLELLARIAHKHARISENSLWSHADS